MIIKDNIQIYFGKSFDKIKDYDEFTVFDISKEPIKVITSFKSSKDLWKWKIKNKLDYEYNQ
jgi:hypothetical protein